MFRLCHTLFHSFLETLVCFCAANRYELDYVKNLLILSWEQSIEDIMNGWLCFVCSIMVIGILTAFIGDLASHFGCTSGVKDTVTAISFVALGTSVPGMP